MYFCVIQDESEEDGTLPKDCALDNLNLAEHDFAGDITAAKSKLLGFKTCISVCLQDVETAAFYKLKLASNVGLFSFFSFFFCPKAEY